MKRRGLASPDNGDALALTFAYPVAVTWRGCHPGSLHRSKYDPYAEFRNGGRAGSLYRSDYDPYAESWNRD